MNRSSSSSSSSSELETWQLISLWTTLAIASCVFGRFTVLYIEDPMLIDKPLIFETTVDSGPVAVTCTDAYYGKWRTSSPYRPLDIYISILVQHTHYNSKCLDFVVRIEYISENGEVSVTSWHPMTVKFRSPLVHNLLSLLRIVPFLSGISSDDQFVRFKSTGIRASSTISCIRVTLQKEGGSFRGGVCVPQISSAHLWLEYQLSHIQGILRDWWYTMYICISMLLFGVGVMCFRDVLIPKRRVRW